VTAHRWSARAYRYLLHLYPREFQDRFAADLEADFAQQLARRTRLGAWCRALFDLARSIPLTHARARAEFGRVHAISLGGEPAMGSLLFDVRHALRALTKAPVFTAVTVLTLALGIGANSAIFSLVNAALLRPLGYDKPGELMMLHEIIPESKVPRFGVSPTDYLDIGQYQHSFSAIGVYRTRPYELSETGAPEQITVAQVSSSVFPILGIASLRGQTFSIEDDSVDRSVVVISDRFARRHFAGRDAIGARVVLNRRPYTVIGVMPAWFEFPKRGAEFNGEPADVYLPLMFTRIERQARGMFYSHSVVGRLRSGVSAEQAAADTGALGARIVENYPQAMRQMGYTLQVTATPLLDEISGSVRRPLLILLGAVGLVLLVACANVANVIMSRQMTRQREIGVRVAMGAARRRLFQMLLTENLILAFAGGLTGLVIGQWAVRTVPAVIASSLPGVSDVTLDARVIAFTFALSLITAVVFGLAPLVSSGGDNVNAVLREGTRATGGREQRRLQAGFVVSSIALAFVLLIGAGLLIRSFANLMAVDPGLRASNVLNFEITLPFTGYNDGARMRGFHQTLYERLRAIPGVRAAVLASDLPVRSDGERRAFTPSGQPSGSTIPPSVAVTWSFGDYLSTFGVPLVRGRNFAPEEFAENRQVVLVSRALAEKYWPGEDPIGKQLHWGGPPSTAPWQTVVGVVGDVVDGQLGSEPVIHVYAPYIEVDDRQLSAPVGSLFRRIHVAVTSETDAAAITPSARAAVAALDPALAMANVTTMAQVLDEASAPQRFSATVLAAFAAGALLLAGIGLYGVLSLGVAQRTREIGVRLALGASRSEVVTRVVRDGMMLAALGLALGAAGAIGTVGLLRALLFGTGAYDLWTFAAVPLLLAIVALMACLIPARRAARVDPTVALRAE
jgi:putative ABC transport system permease protein